MGEPDMVLHDDAFKLVYLSAWPMNAIDPAETDVLWVLSTGRCGTSTMAELLGAIPNMVCLHETMPRLGEWYEAALDCRFDDLIRAVRLDLTSGIQPLGKWYGEAGHHLTPFAESIKAVYKRAKFIYLRRDMDGYTKSAYNWSLYHPEHDKYLANRPKPPYGLSRSQKIAWLWCRVNENITDFLYTIPDNDWCFLDFERIRNHGLGPLWDTLESWGLERPDEERIEQILYHKYNKGNANPLEKDWQSFDSRADEIGRLHERT